MTQESTAKDTGVQQEEPKPADRPAHRTDHEAWPEEIGGQKGPEPTRYGDWEKNGRVSDF